MNLKRSSSTIQDKNYNDLENEKGNPKISDLMREEKVYSNETNSVHHRRDLDSLG